jgi:site-specific DNA recombinase
VSTVEDHPGGEALFKPKRAVLYLRVSTPGQMNTDYDPEGISIPTQRAKGVERALSLGAQVVEEFIEPGRTATKIDGRKKFQEMMAYIRAHKDIDYVIVFNRARLFRNSVDAAITKRELKKLGCTVISILDYTEDTPVGDLIATVLDAFNEYQSRAQGADIALKMAGKVERGGSVARAQLGYLNVREVFEGREIRTVAVDPERAPLVLAGFELFATGTYTYDTLLEALTDAGLRSRPTKKHPAGAPISKHKLGQMLQDRFYIGMAKIKGKEYPGRHETFVPRELFDRVQEVIAEHGGGEGTRKRRYTHYLKGSLWCARSGHRIWYIPGTSKTGEVYFYFMCSGRQKHACDLPYMKVDQVERAVEDNYATVTLSSDLRALITSAMRAAMTDSDGTDSLMRAQLMKQLAALDAKVDGLLDLVGHKDWPNEKLSAKMSAVREEKGKVERQLAQLTAPNLDDGHSALTTLLELLGDASRLYRLAGSAARKVLNQVFFTRIYMDETDGVPFVASDEPTDVVRPLVEIQRGTHGVSAGTGQHNGGTEFDSAAAKITPTVLLTTALAGGGSSKTAMVEPRGLEPLTFCLPELLFTSPDSARAA